MQADVEILDFVILRDAHSTQHIADFQNDERAHDIGSNIYQPTCWSWESGKTGRRVCRRPDRRGDAANPEARVNQTIPGEELVQKIWGTSARGVHSLRVFIKSLRSKLELDPKHPQFNPHRSRDRLSAPGSRLRLTTLNDRLRAPVCRRRPFHSGRTVASQQSARSAPRIRSACPWEIEQTKSRPGYRDSFENPGSGLKSGKLLQGA
jgi:hypothetical protein